MDRRKIEQTDMLTPDRLVPFVHELLVENPSLHYARRYVPEVVRLRTADGSIAVRFWFEVDYPYPENIIRQISRQLPSVKLQVPSAGIDGSFVELWTSTWRTRFNPYEMAITVRRGALDRADLATFDWGDAGWRVRE